MDGSRAHVAWNAAVDADENDPRWKGVEQDNAVSTFGTAFKVALPPMGRRRNANPVFQLTTFGFSR